MASFSFVVSALQVFFPVPDRDAEAAARQARAPPGLAENDVRVRQYHVTVL
jgi:hypothetical protein